MSPWRKKNHLRYGHGSTSSGDVKKVNDFYNQGDRCGKDNNYGNLGNAYCSPGDFKKDIEYYNVHLKIA